jgi:hypothetical protein
MKKVENFFKTESFGFYSLILYSVLLTSLNTFLIVELLSRIITAESFEIIRRISFPPLLALSFVFLGKYLYSSFDFEVRPSKTEIILQIIPTLIVLVVFFKLKHGLVALLICFLVSIPSVILAFYNSQSFTNSNLNAVDLGKSNWKVFGALRFLLIPICIAVATVPFFVPRYLGDETLGNERIVRDIEKLMEPQSTEVIFQFSDRQDFLRFLSLELYAAGVFPNNSYPFRKSENSVGFFLVGQNLQPLCFFLKDELGSSSFAECLKFTLEKNPKKTEAQAAKLGGFNLPPELVKIGTEHLKKSSFINSDKVKEINNLVYELDNSFVRGKYFHHYYSALSAALIDSGTLANQYGIAGGFLPWLIHKITGLNLIASLEAYIVAVNLFILTVLVCLINGNFNWIPRLGFFLSVSSVVVTSGTIAPMLFPARFFPYIGFILALYSFQNWSSDSNTSKHSRLLKLSVYVFAALGGFWDSFYGLIFLFSLLLTYVISTSRWLFPMILAASIGFLTQLIASLALTSSPVPSTPLREYLLGVNSTFAFDSVSLTVVMVSLTSALIFFVVTRTYLSRSFSDRRASSGIFNSFDTTLFVATFSVILCVKPLWNGSENHVGIIYLTVFLVVYSLLKHNLAPRSFLYAVMVIFIFLGFVKPLPSAVFSSLESSDYPRGSAQTLAKFAGFNWLISPAANQYLRNFESLSSGANVLLSPADNLLQLYAGRRLTIGHIDYSTNLNSYEDVGRIVDFLKTNPPEKVLIDKSVFRSQELGSFAIYASDDVRIPLLNRKKYVSYLLEIYDKYVRENYSVSRENENFILFVRH